MLVASHLGQKLAPAGLEVKDEEEPVPVRGTDIAVKRGSGDR